MKLHVLAWLLLHQANVYGQPMSARLQRTIPVTCAYSKNSRDAFSFTSNQGALPGIKQPLIGLYSEKRFMLRDLNLFMVSFVFPHTSGAVGMIMNYSGNKFYNQTNLGLCFGKKISDLLSLGIQFNYSGDRAAGGANSKAVNFETGVILHITEAIQAGFQVKNPAKVKRSGAQLPAVFAAAVGFDCSEKLFLGSSVEKQESMPANVIVALHYSFLPAISIDCGITSAENNFFLGISVEWKQATLQMNAGYHSYLGFTPAFAMVFPLAKQQKE